MAYERRLQFKDILCVDCSFSLLGKEIVMEVHSMQVLSSNDIVPKLLVELESRIKDEGLGGEKRFRICNFFYYYAYYSPSLAVSTCIKEKKPFFAEDYDPIWLLCCIGCQ